MNSTLKFFGFSTPNSKREEPLAESTVISTERPSTPLQNDIYRGKRRTASPLTNKNLQRMKIDSHVLTDAQSSGIVSRLVKYYDQSQNDASDRSRIVYNKVGDFPLVQLKKNEIKRSISRATSVRIAPPNKTIMNRDLRAAIMRSNSFQFGSGIPKVQPVKMRAKDDSHKIITNHEPLNEEAYPASSNSVLDALEKNCRKRINNEELILDRSKKFCLPVAPVYEINEPSTSLPTSAVPQSAKRNREPSSPQSKQPSFDFQQRSKKFRTRNNALLVSLSSSHYQLIPSTPPSSPQANKTQNINKSLQVASKTHEVIQEKEKTPIEEKNDEKETVDAPKEKSPKPQVDVPKKLQLFNRKPDSNAIQNRAKFHLYDSDEEDVSHVKFVKPKDQVIEGNDDRKELEKAKLTRMLDSLTKGTDLPFKPKEKPKDTVDAVKPVELPKASISFNTSSTKAIIAPISSAEITTVASSSTASTVQSSSASTGFQLSTGISLSTKTDEKKEEVQSNVPKISTSIPSLSSILSTSESVKDKAIEIPKTTSSGIQFSFGSTQSSTSVPLLQASATPISFGSMSQPTKPQESSEKPALPSIPSLGGFQFGQLSAPTTSQSTVTTSSLTVTTSLPQPAMKPVSPLALFSTSAITTKPIEIAPKIDNPTTTASGIGFSFGGTKSTISGIKPITPSPTDTSSSLKTAGISFNFGTKPSVPISEPPSFNFGSSLTTSSTATPQQQQQPAQSKEKPSFSFGGNSIAPTPSFAKPEVPKSSFSFGNSTQPSSSTPVSTPIFGQLNSAAVTSPSSGFSFSSLSNAPTTEPPVFGTFTTPATTTANSGSIFGSVKTTTQSQSVFGGFNSNNNNNNNSSSTNTFSSNPPSFGQSSGDTVKTSFSFGSANQAPIVSASSSSVFGSSQVQAKPSFNFGGTAAQPPSQQYGGINSAPSQENKPSFNFTSSTNAPNAFGTQQSVASAPVFNSTQSPFASSQESQKAAFNFNNPNSSFNFMKPQDTSSTFGSSQSIESKPSFNFGQASPQLPQMAQVNANNAQGGLFNIGTAGQQQQRKPFRTATRRLK